MASVTPRKKFTTALCAALALFSCATGRQDTLESGSHVSTLSAEPTEVPADGVSAATLTITLQSATGEALPGAVVVLETSCADAQLTQPPALGSLGTASATLSRATAGSCLVSGHVTLDGAAMPLSQTATVKFVPASAGLPDPATELSIAVSPNVAVADGRSAVALRISATNARGNPVSGRSVMLEASGSDGVIDPSVATLGPDGTLTAKFTSTQSETKTVTAKLDGLVAQAQVTFVAGAADANASTLTVTPKFCVADAPCPFLARVLARDAHNNSVPQVPVTWHSSDGNDLIQPAAGTTGPTGELTATFLTHTVGDKVLTAQVGPFTLQTFYAGVAASPNVILSGLTVASDAVVADGASIAAITVRVADDMGRVMANLPVRLQALGPAGTLQPDSGTTDSNGEFTATYSSASVGKHVIIATLQGVVSLTQNVNFISGAPSFSASQFFISPSRIAADNNQTADITLVLRDSDNNPAAHVETTFGSSNAGVHVVPSHAFSDDQGRVTATLTAATAGNFTISAATAATTLTAPISCTVGPPNPGVSALCINPNTVLADGVSQGMLQLDVFDLLGNPVPNIAVNVLPTGVALQFSNLTGNTDATGKFAAAVSASQAQNTVISLDVAGTTVSAQAQFVPGLPSPVHSSIAAQPNLVVVGSGPSVLVVAVKDAAGNPVPGVAVNLEARDPGLQLSATVGTTDAAGFFYTQVRAIRGGLKTIDATVGAMHLSQKITAIAGVPSAATSALVPTPDKIVADGISSAQLTFSVRDIVGNPVVGAPVTFSGDHPEDVFNPAQGVTDDQGLATSRWTTTRMGPATLHAQARDLIVRAQAQATAGAASPLTSTCMAQPGTLVADGTAAATLSLSIADAFGNAVADGPVTLVSQGANIVVVPTAGPLSSHGTFSAAARSTVAQAGRVIAVVGNTQIVCGLTFVAGPADGAASSAAAVPSLVPADGNSTGLVTVTFRDAFSNPIAGREATLSTPAASATLSATRATTDALGKLTVSLASTVPQNTFVAAQLDGIVQQANLTFVAGPPGALSTLNVSPSAVTADGVTPATLTVVARDSAGTPVAFEPVSLRLTGGPATIAPASGNTDAAGTFTATSTSTVAGSRVVTAAAGTAEITAALNFVPGPLNQAASVFTVSPNQLVADGVTELQLQFVARDAYNNPIAGQSSTVTSNLPSLVGAAMPATDALGQASTVRRNTVASPSHITLTAAGQTFAADANWIAGPVSPGHSAFALNPNSAAADGSATLVGALTLLDAFDNPVPGVAVAFAVTGGNNQIVPPNGVTDNAGKLNVALQSTTAQNKSVSAFFEAKTLSAGISFVAGPPDVGNSSLVLQPNVVIADGLSAGTLTLTLKDAFGNAVGSAALNGNSSGTTAPFAGTTDVNGAYTTAVSSTYAQQENITVVSGAAQFLTQITFVPGAPAAANSSFSVTPNSLIADATSQAAVVLVVRDAYNNTIPGAQVRLDDAPVAGDVYGPRSGLTDASGSWATTIASSSARVGSLRVALGASGTSPTLSAPITFFAGPPAASASSLTVSPNSVVADGNTQAQLQARVLDFYGNPVSGAAVRLSASQGNCALAPSMGVTDATGLFAATVTSTLAQAQIISAGLGDVASNQSISAVLTFVPGPPTAEQSVLVAAPNPVVADGTSLTTITAQLRDAKGNPTPNQTVTLSSTGGNNVIVQPTPSAQAGSYAGTVSSTRAQTKVLTAYFNSRSIQTSVTFVAGPAVTATSSLVASPNTGIWANGVQTARLVATFADAYGNLVGNQPVTMSSDQPDTFNPSSGTTAADGSFSTKVSGRTAGAHQLKATGGAAQPTAQVTFLPAAYPASSTLTASPNVLTADANTAVTLTLTARDGNNTPLPGAAVRWGALVPGFNFSPGTSITDASGNAVTAMRGGVVTQQTAFANLTGVRLTTPVQLNPRAPACTNTMSYNGLPWPDVNFGEQKDAAVADLNHDGIPDLAALNVYGSVTVLIGKGGRTWQPPVSYNVGGTSLVLFLQDINGDSNPDLITLSRDYPGVFVSLGRGDGTFANPLVYRTDLYPDDMALMDVNNDNIADIVSMNASRQSYSILLGSADGSFQTHMDYPLGMTPTGLAVGSVVSSSNDIVLTTRSANTLSILPNLGSGTFGAATVLTVGYQPKDVVVGDLTGDGLNDIVVGNSDEKTFGVIKNLGGGSLGPMQKYPTGDNITGLAIAQLGGSASLDVLAYTRWKATSYLYENPGNGNLVLKASIPSGANVNKIRIADIDADGNADVLLPMQSARTQLQLQYGNGAYGVLTNNTYSAFGAVHAVGADFNGDGFQDVFVSGFGASHRLYLGDGSGHLGTPTSINSAGGSASSGPPVVRDFDNDGYPDVAVTNSGPKTVSIFLHGAPGPFQSPTTYAVGNNPRNISSGDINGDGYIDLIVVNQDGANLSVLLGRGDGTFIAGSTVAVGADPADAVLADFDGDGTLDLAVANRQAGTVGVLFNDGMGNWGTMATYPTAYGVKQLAVADFNADGRLDLAVLGAGNDPISVLNNAGGTFTAGPVTGRIVAGTQLLVGDFNRDGRTDIAALTQTDSAIIVYLNVGGSSFAVGRPYDSGAMQPNAFNTVDLTGDGILDFVAIHNAAATVATVLYDGCY